MTALMAFLEVTIYMHFQEDIEGVFNKEKDALNLYGIHARFGRYRGIDELRKPLSVKAGYPHLRSSPGARASTEKDITTGDNFASFGERHCTVAEIAEMWNLSSDAVRRLFCNEPGVLILGSPARGTKRRYTTLRIPQSVLDRVHRRLSFG